MKALFTHNHRRVVSTLNRATEAEAIAVLAHAQTRGQDGAYQCDSVGRYIIWLFAEGDI